MPKKFQTYKCTTCKRTIDIAFDPKRPFIEKCNITFGCTGALSKIGEKDIGNLHASYQYGVENWRGRNEKAYDATPPSEEVFRTFSSCRDHEFVIGVDAELVDASATLNVVFDTLKLAAIQLTDKSQIFSEYVFKFSLETISPTLNGVDDSPVPQALAFDESHDVLVFLNGVQQLETTAMLLNRDFVTYLTDTSLPVNSLKFNKTLPEMSVVTVIVRKKIDGKNVTLELTANKILANSKPGPWSNVESIKCYVNIAGDVKEKTYYLFTIDSAEQAGLNVRLHANVKENDNSINLSHSSGGVTRTESLSSPTHNNPALGSNFDSVIGIFSNGNLDTTDRDTFSFFRFSKLRGTDGFLKFMKIDNKYLWVVSDSVIEKSYYPIEINNYIIVNGQYKTDA